MSKNNSRLAVNLLTLALGMLLLAYGSVPLYRLFCQATGYGGTTQSAAQAPGRVGERLLTVNFNADTQPGLPWVFEPGERYMSIRIGEREMTHYVARNLSDKPVTGRAVYNVVPFAAGAYFNKIECFCFKEQTLAAGQQVDMPVAFFIDPAILDDPDLKGLKTITLSYTFFPLKTEPKPRITR